MYVCSPYSHPDPAVREHRYEAACRATAMLLRAGLTAFSPVVHSHPLTRHGLPSDWEFWQRYDRAHLEACTSVAVLMLDGWKKSEGVRAEIRIAFELGLPVFLIEPVRVGIRAKNVPAAGAQGTEVTT